MTPQDNGEGSTVQRVQENETTSRLSSDSPLTSLDSSEEGDIIITQESQPSENNVSRGIAPAANQVSTHTVTDAHQGWDASNISTAKCDFCQRQRCGTLQKCSTCKLSVCRECCVAGCLKNDQKHILDPDAVSWDVPRNSRKRKARDLETDKKDEETATKRRGRTRPRGSRSQNAALPSTSKTSSIIPPVVPGNEEPRSNTVGLPGAERQVYTARRTTAYHAPIEPRLSVEPVMNYPQLAQRRQLPLFSETRSEAGPSMARQRYPSTHNNSSSSSHYHATAQPRPSSIFPPRHSNSQAASGPSSHHTPARTNYPMLPLPQQPAPEGRTLLDANTDRYINISPRSNSAVRHSAENRHHSHPPAHPSQGWPSPHLVHTLGTQLVDAVQSRRAANVISLLDQYLQEEIKRLWTSESFFLIEPNVSSAYRAIIAAAHWASASLRLPPNNSAREWLCQLERRLRERGYEPIKSHDMMRFLQDVGISYLQQGQR